MVNLTNLFKTIEKKGLTKSQVAKDTGISSGNISDWQSGRSMPTAIKLDVLADYLDVSVDYLLGRTDEPNGYNNNSINISGHKQLDEMSEELLKRFNELPFDEKLDVFTYIKNKT